MAASPPTQVTDRQERNERYLAWVAALVAEIPLTANEWARLPEGERAGFAAAWDNSMGMVETLITDYWAGDLSTAQRDHLFALVRQIEHLAPPLHQMEFHGPDSRGLAVLFGPSATTTSD